METKFWTLFRPRSTASLDSQSYRYESCAAGAAPVRGELPVRGNGPSILDLYRQGNQGKNSGLDRQDRFRAVLNKDDEPAPPKAVPMTKVTRDRETNTGISRTNSSRTMGRRLSIKKIKGLAKGKSSPDLRSQSPRTSVPKPPVPVLTSHFPFEYSKSKPLPNVPKAVGKAKGHRRKSTSTHIDLFDAVPAIKASQKDEAGRRNYGEDVADRNISMYVPERTSIGSYPNRKRGSSDVGACSSSYAVPADADWLNQPWVQEGSKPWEEARKGQRSSGARSTRSIRSLKQEASEEWPIKSRNRSKSDAGALRTNETQESSDDASFELGAVMVSDDIFYPG